MLLPTAVLVLLIAIYGDAMENSEDDILRLNGMYCQKLDGTWAVGEGEEFLPGFGGNTKVEEAVGIEVPRKTEGMTTFCKTFSAPNGGKIAGAVIWDSGVAITEIPVSNMELSDDSKKLNIDFVTNDDSEQYMVTLHTR